MDRILNHSTRARNGVRLNRNSQNQVLGLTIQHGTHSVYYHRTGRGVSEIFHSQSGELRSFFTSPQKFFSFSEGKRILDLGCGEGELAKNLQNKSLLAVGVDFYLSESQITRNFLVQADAYALPFESQSFHCVLSTWSAFHYEPHASLYSLFSEVKRVLLPKGFLYLSPISEVERIQQIKLICRRLSLKASLCLQTGALRCEK